MRLSTRKFGKFKYFIVLNMFGKYNFMLLSKNELEFNVNSIDNSYVNRAINVGKLFSCRYGDRDVEEVSQVLNIKRGSGYKIHVNPGICRRSRYLVTNDDVIEVQGWQTSGEVEFVSIIVDDEVLISVGSDNNDRVLTDMWSEFTGKIYDSAKTKQMVPAAIANEAWKYEDVKDHWDRIRLKSYVTDSGNRIPYQDFPLSDLLDLEYYFRNFPDLKSNGSVFFGGTGDVLSTVPKNLFQFQSSLKNVAFPSDFHFEIYDPVLDRKISHGYKILSIEEYGSLSL